MADALLATEKITITLPAAVADYHQRGYTYRTEHNHADDGEKRLSEIIEAGPRKASGKGHSLYVTFSLPTDADALDRLVVDTEDLSHDNYGMSDGPQLRRGARAVLARIGEARRTGAEPSTFDRSKLNAWIDAYVINMEAADTKARILLSDMRATLFADEVTRMVRAHPGMLTPDDYVYLSGLVGRTFAPGLLSAAWHLRKITLGTLQAQVGPSWSGAEFPDRLMTRQLWRGLFAAAGFTVDGVPAPRPAEPIELYRGSVPKRRRDWSWTTDRAIAEKYAAGGMAGRPDGSVYRTVALPSALLCANSGRQESEYVIDTRGLKITEA
jgi:hypothetical protein